MTPSLTDITVLDRICADTRAEVARRKERESIDALRGRVSDAPPVRSFINALTDATCAGRFGLIAEIKRASPSGGLIRPDCSPPDLSRAYKEGGAVCLSVLTDELYFKGSPADLKAARAAVDLPVLRKDFMLDPWQIYESRAMGADCVLLIMTVLTDETAVELENLARALDMCVLAEVHDEQELERALGLQTKLIGINNRNLKDLHTNIQITETLAPLVPPDRVLVGESGLRSHADLQRMAAAGVTNFLVGESLLRQPDVTQATRKLLNG